MQDNLFPDIFTEYYTVFSFVLLKFISFQILMDSLFESTY